MAWTPEELGEATDEFPSLKSAGQSSISGVLSVCGAMQGQNLLLNPSESQLEDAEAQATFLVDSFTVEVGSTSSGPFLKLLGTRSESTAKKYGIRLVDLHIYSNRSVCFAAPQEIAADWASGMSPSKFIWRYALPFLYEQAFFDKHGRWPWGELAHGSLGLLEWLGRKRNPTDADVMRTILCLESSAEDARKLIRARARRHHLCPCGSRKRLGECHPDIKPAIDIVRSWIAQGKCPRPRKTLLG